MFLPSISVHSLLNEKTLLEDHFLFLFIQQSGAAPLNCDVASYFASYDIPLYEIYGLSESSGPCFISSKDYWKIGWCGRPLVATDVVIDSSNGEICIDGRHVFMGYMYNKEATFHTFDTYGHLRTGDMGEIEIASGLARISKKIEKA